MADYFGDDNGNAAAAVGTTPWDAYGAGGADYLLSDGGPTRMMGGAGNDELQGGSGVDVLDGDGAITVSLDKVGFIGNDTLYGAGGDDLITGGQGDDYIDGGEDNDELWDDADRFYNPNQNMGNVEFSTFDTPQLNGGFGADDIYGGEGDDIIHSAGGADYLDGGEDFDVLSLDRIHFDGGISIDFSLGGEGELGDDTQYTGFEALDIRSGSGDDTLQGGNAVYSEAIYAGGGDDTIIVSANGLDFYDGGLGTDTLDFSEYEGSVFIDLSQVSTPGLMGARYIENVVGGFGADTLYGASGDNDLYGGDGVDILEGDHTTYSRQVDNLLLNALDRPDNTYESQTLCDVSPNGDLVLFTATVDGVRNAFIKNLATGVVSAVTFSEPSDFVGSASFVSNTQVAYTLGASGVTHAYITTIGSPGDTILIDQVGGTPFAQGVGLVLDAGPTGVLFTSASDEFGSTPYDQLYLRKPDGQIVLISQAEGGSAPSNASVYDQAQLSGDGRYVVFTSGATNLVSQDTNGTSSDVFRYDIQTDTLVRVTSDAGGVGFSGYSLNATISSDGNLVAFVTTEALSGDDEDGGQPDVYIKNMTTGEYRMVGINSDFGNFEDLRFSEDDSELLFYTSSASVSLLYAFDLSEGEGSVVSMDRYGMLGDSRSDTGFGLADGRYIYQTYSTNLTGAYAEDYAPGFLGGPSIIVSTPGTAGNDYLDGGAGADEMLGGGGNDIYIVDDAGDDVTEAVDQGIDQVRTGLSYGLGLNVEKLLLTGSANINGTGNALDNTIEGNTGNNKLNGGVGADTLKGGLGSDTYIVDNAADVIVEAASAGTDTVQSSITIGLAANVENLLLLGAANISGSGNGLVNLLTGNDGNNKLDGKAGADTMKGGLGSDTYVIDNAGDVVTEAASAGTDTIQTYVHYTLSANVENGVVVGDAAANLTGNTLNNTLTGNARNNTLNGGAGVDTLKGGVGNDTYVVDNAGDKVIEVNGEGTDTIQSSLTWSLEGVFVERLTLTGASNINATGNSLANILTGNTGANVLDGLTGADTMDGGAGGDRYIVDNAGDKVIEADVTGDDHVLSSVTFSLAGQFIERLTLTGTAAINATGNSLANGLTGNAAANILDGGTGNDVLTGGAGGDRLIGGGGNDRFVYASTAESTVALSDRITDLNSGDIIDLKAVDANVNLAGDQAFARVASFSGVAGQMTVTYSAATNVTTVLMDVNGDKTADMMIRLDGNQGAHTGWVF